MPKLKLIALSLRVNTGAPDEIGIVKVLAAPIGKIRGEDLQMRFRVADAVVIFHSDEVKCLREIQRDRARGGLLILPRVNDQLIVNE